jgi:hypothetical protein
MRINAIISHQITSKRRFMARLSKELKGLLARTKLVVFPEDYVVVYLPLDGPYIPGEWFRPATTRFAAVIQEPNVITMVIPRRKWLRMKNIFDKYDVNGPLKVISFDVKLSLPASGYMSAIGTVLTNSDISAIPIFSFKGDHIIVPKADLPRTVKVLREFLAGFKKKPTRRATKS